MFKSFTHTQNHTTSCFNDTVREMIWNAVDIATDVKHPKQSEKKNNTISVKSHDLI